MLLLFQCVQHLTLTKLYGLSHCIRLAIDASSLVNYQSIDFSIEFILMVYVSESNQYNDIMIL